MLIAPPTKVFLIGAYGQVGWELRRALLPFGEVRAFDRDTLNLLDESAVRGEVRDFSPDVIVNAAAYTAVDRAETERELCRSLNVRAPEILAEEAEKLGAWMVHYSTDYVFNGKNDRPWTEGDVPDPVNYYGESKLDGDMAVARAASRHLIFRTSWVYASRGSNFPLTMLRLFTEKKELRVVNDQLGAPTWARYIAQATLSALGRSLAIGDAGLSGVYNLVNSGVTSWYEFAREIRDCAGGFGDVVLRPISSADYQTAAARPMWSVLSTEKISRVFGVYPAHWRDAMKLCVAEIKERQNIL
jgi:dTDP-4-dehydrorhamnose reductase